MARAFKPRDPTRFAKMVREAEAQPAALKLAELRKGRNLLQQEIAQHLGVDQSEISRLENRLDAHLSTLRRYVKALGGRLELRAVFPENEFVIERFSDLDGPPRRAARVATSRS